MHKLLIVAKIHNFFSTCTHPVFNLLLFSSSVTSAFSLNVNPNRLSTEGYCSSSQKRRQIFRYWGAADFELHVAMPISESGLLIIVVTCCGLYTFAWRFGWLIPALHLGAANGPCMAALWFYWKLIDQLTFLPMQHQKILFFHIFVT